MLRIKEGLGRLLGFGFAQRQLLALVFVSVGVSGGNLMREQVKNAELKAADVIRRGCGAVINVCFRDESNWTIYGDRASVDKAVEYLVRIRFCRLVNQEVDEEDGEVFAYISLIDY